MFSKFTMRLIRLYFKVCNLHRNTPYIWDDQQQSLKVTSSVLQKANFYLAYYQALFYLGFLLLRLVFITRGPKQVNFVAVAWITIFIAFYVWGSVSYHNGSSNKYQTVALFRGLLKLNNEFQARNHGASFSSRLLNLHFLVCLWVLFLYDTSVCLMFVAVPNRPQYLYSLYSQDKNRNSWQYFLFLCFEIYSKTVIGGMMAMDGISIFSVLLSTKFWLKYFRSAKRDSSPLLNIQNYRKLHLLVIYFNYSFTWLLIPILFCWTPACAAITGGFAAVRFQSFLPFFEYFPFPSLFSNMLLVISVTIVPAATVYDSSCKLYNDIRTSPMCQRSKKLRKEVRSLRPFGVHFGPIQNIRRVAILMIYYFISNNVFTFLITFPPNAISQ